MSADLPGFKIIEKIGTGGMATVWQANQISLDRIVAIKILNPRFTSHPDDVQRFQREAQSAAKLKHPGVVQVYDANAVDGIYYFVMEYVSGYTVGQWIARKGVLRESNALLVAECIGEALKYAWDAQKIIHCDIKPDNILVDADGTVKVSDLGLARTISAMALVEDESDEVMGTPYYISPEQAQGKADQDVRADIYSLGAMMFHMLTGRMPFQGEDPESVMELQVTTDLPRITEINPDVSEGAADLVARMVEKDPDDRPADWDAILAQIEAVKSGRNAVSDGRSDTMRLQKRHDQIERIQGKPKHAVLRTLVRLLVLTVIVVGVVFYVNSVVTQPRTLPTETPPASVTPRPDPGPGLTPPPDPMEALRAQLADAREWANAHPDEFDRAIQRFQAVVSAAPDSDVALAAGSEIKLLELAKSDALTKTLNELLENAAALAGRDELLAAAELLENYLGAFANDTSEQRRVQAKVYRDQKLEAVTSPSPTPTDVSTEELLDIVAEHLLAGNGSLAVRRMTGVLWSMDPGAEQEQLKRVYDVVRSGAAAKQTVLDSLTAQTGRVVSLELVGGARNVMIHNVFEGRIGIVDAARALDPDPPVVHIALDDLSYRERLARTASADAEATALSRGLMALEAKSKTYAIRYFADTHEALAGRLVAGLRQ